MRGEEKADALPAAQGALTSWGRDQLPWFHLPFPASRTLSPSRQAQPAGPPIPNAVDNTVQPAGGSTTWQSRSSRLDDALFDGQSRSWPKETVEISSTMVELLCREPKHQESQ